MIAGEKKKVVPILQCHGKSIEKEDLHFLFEISIGNKDSIIHINRARLTEECFKSMGFQEYTFKEYDGMDHTDCEQVSHFLLKTNSVYDESTLNDVINC